MIRDIAPWVALIALLIQVVCMGVMVWKARQIRRDLRAMKEDDRHA